MCSFASIFAPACGAHALCAFLVWSGLVWSGMVHYMSVCMYVCMFVCMYVCIDSSARRPNHTSYTDETTSVSNYRRSGKYPRVSETVSEKCPGRDPRGVREGSGRGPGGVRERSGRGPKSAVNGSEVV